MPGRHLKVIVTRKLPEPVEARMSELFDVELNADDTPMGPHALADAMHRADVLVPTITDNISAGLIAARGALWYPTRRVSLPMTPQMWR